MLIKTRRAKNSKRGLYLQDRQLRDTVFQPGTHYKYVIDLKNRKMVILASEDEGNTVCKRDLKKMVKPVLDIRSKKALEVFEGCEYLQVEIHEDQIVVSGYVTDSDKLLSKAKRLVSKFIKTGQKAQDISDLLHVKKTAEIVLDKEELEQEGGYEQLSFSFDEIEYPARSTNVQYMERAIQNLHIPLQVDCLFAGAGLFDYGFLKSGYEIMFAVEMNPDAVKTYRANIGNHILQKDVTKVDTNRYSSPIMIGGSPCQGFSNSNRYTNYLDNPNNRLVRSYIDAVKANKNCKVFVLENVPQILTAGNGKFKDEILAELSDFDIEYQVLNAADYGTPQARKRAILIGSKIGKIKMPVPTHIGHHVTVREQLSGLTRKVSNQHDISKAKEVTLERIKSVPAGGNINDIPEAIRPNGKHSDMYKRIDWDKPSVTIVHPRKSMLLHPEEDRILSVRECARIQGLSDEFVFHGSLSGRQQQVANGVPFQLAKAIAKVIRESITKFNNSLQLQPAY